uniref:Amine oxidase domain-containing protein n=1 Tax=Chenopodium quinoa TaxID=63459 RepID=A0A803LSR1_CHEQI
MEFPSSMVSNWGFDGEEGRREKVQLEKWGKLEGKKGEKIIKGESDRNTCSSRAGQHLKTKSKVGNQGKVICLPLSVIITTFKKANVKRPLEGFGVLVPSNEQHNGLKTLGTLFSSMMFPDRAPSDVYLYTTFVGGSRNRELAKASKDELKQIVSSDLQQLLGTDAEPSFMNHYYWSNAFPLYGRNYDSVLRAIEKMERDLPGVFYAGNHKDGLSVGKSIASGYKAAEHVISYLDSKLDAKMKTL